MMHGAASMTPSSLSWREREMLASTDAVSRFGSLRDIEKFVGDFEAGLIAHRDWDHHAHLTVAAWYLSRYPEGEATERMIRGIRRHNHANGIAQTTNSGYHETITLFWLVVIRTSLAAIHRGWTLAARIDQVVNRLAGDKALIFEFYDRERLFSDEARARWMPPHRYPGGRLAAFSQALGDR
jgi:hypothetical protein